MYSTETNIIQKYEGVTFSRINCLKLQESNNDGNSSNSAVTVRYRVYIQSGIDIAQRVQRILVRKISKVTALL